jgi:hypothetical protein
MANAIEVNFKELDMFIERAYHKHTALYIHGGIGIGKSTRARVKAELIAKGKNKEFVEWNKISKGEKLKLMENEEYRKNKFILIDLRGTQLADGSDVKGIPKFTDGYVEWVLNLAFKFMSLPHSDGILFLDELNLTVPTVQASLYQIINDKCIVETAINSDWGIISAGNRTEDRCHSFDMAFPLRNRFTHIELLPPSSEQWVEDYAEPMGINSNLIAFVLWKKDMIYKVNTDSNDFAYPTPRSIEKASIMLDEGDSMDVQRKIVASCVGKEFASLYIEFVELIRKLPVDEILKNPKLMERYTDLKNQCGLMMAFVERYRGDKKVFENVFECGMYLPVELGAYLFKSMKNVNKNNFVNSAPKTKVFKEFVKRYKDLIAG